jgi:hypothetical protein
MRSPTVGADRSVLDEVALRESVTILKPQVPSTGSVVASS